MKHEIFVISDIENFCKTLVDSAITELENNTPNLTTSISIGQITNLVDDYCLGYDNNGLPLVDEEIMNQIYQDIKVWLNNISLAKLASNNILECAWDTNLNEMVFWYPSQEVQTNGKRTNSIRNKSPKR